VRRHRSAFCQRTDLQKLESGQGKIALVWSINMLAKYNDCSAKVDAWIKLGKALKEQITSQLLE
jgi:hypothetical protein